MWVTSSEATLNSTTIPQAYLDTDTRTEGQLEMKTQ
jgi:hypothetical protein